MANPTKFTAINVTEPIKVNGVASSGGVFKGASATVTGSLVVATGLTSITSYSATLGEDAAISGNAVSATASAGNLTIKVTKPTSISNPTPIAADTAKVVKWIAIGT